MNISKPIFQMVLIENENNNLGLSFSSEVANDYSQVPLFCIPITYDLSDAISLEKYLKNKDVYLPFYSKGEAVNIFGQINFPFIEFNLSTFFNINKKITFAFETNYHSQRHFFYSFKKNTKIVDRIKKIPARINTLRNGKVHILKYVGSWDKIDKNSTGFLLITPVGRNALTDLFRLHKILPVGLTPKFGKIVSEKKIER